MHHKNATNQTNTLHFIPKNSGKNGIGYHYTILYKCNTKMKHTNITQKIWTHITRCRLK